MAKENELKAGDQLVPRSCFNNQLPEKQVDGSILKVHSIFRSIQGEGPLVGEPAIFIRMAGCNLQCKGCDTDYTSEPTSWDPLDLAGHICLMATAAGFNPLVVITGGEPFRQNITRLVEGLLFAGLRVQIETNGTLALKKFPYGQVTIVCSPKTPKINPVLVPHISAYKYVIQANGVDPEDGLPSKILGKDQRVARPIYGGPMKITKRKVFVQPFDDQNNPENSNQAAALAVALTYGYRFGLQIHKLVELL